jgi:diguanylate cyclase
MLRTSSSVLQQVLEELEQATLEHALWRDHLVRVISGREPANPEDLRPDAHRHCLFGRWYFERSPADVRQRPSYAMIGAEHADQHRLATELLENLANGVPITRAAIEEFEEASARLSYALHFVKREIECTLSSRDAITEAHSSGEMIRDLREWHALAGRPGRQCCIALMELDGQRELDEVHGFTAGAQALVNAVRIIAAHLRASDRVFRYDGRKFLVRLSGTQLTPAKTVIARLRDALDGALVSTGAGGATIRRTASFGIAMLDPDVDVLESIDRADQALTLAKTAGGNRIITWDPSITTARLRRVEIKEVQGAGGTVDDSAPVRR